MRIMGLDFGSKTVGVAVSDPLMVTAQPVEIIRRKEENKLRQTYARIEELVKEYDVEFIVLGYPKNMNNTIGERAEKTEDFMANLKRRTGLDIILWDESLRREERKEYVDMIAAVFILQGYMDSLAIKNRMAEDNSNSEGLED